MLTNRIILGNVISLVGAAIAVIIGLTKDRKKMVLFQSFQAGVMAVSNFVLGGISGVIINITTFVRNIICYNSKFTKPLKILFIAAQIVLTYCFGVKGILMWLPVIAGCSLTWVLDTENALLLKIVMTVGQVLWGIFDISIKNYSMAVFDTLAVITSIIAMKTLISEKRNKENG